MLKISDLSRDFLAALFLWIFLAPRRAMVHLKEFKLGRSGNDFEIPYLIENFRGKRIWNKVSKRDWLIWSTNLYAPNLIIVGGYKGNSARLFLERIPNIEKIHIYEPDSLHFLAIQELLSGNEKVKVHQEAIYNGDQVNLAVSDDASLIIETGREIPAHLLKKGEIKVRSVSLSTAVERIVSDQVHLNYSIYMNCEGSEYLILDQIDKLSNLPKSLIIQTHTTDDNSLIKLYGLRLKLISEYYPVLLTDFSWDIWIHKSFVSRTLKSIEQDSL